MAATWYPVALAETLENGSSAGTRIRGREIAIWRDNEGTAHAWEDRCPHRGVRLSLGFVRGNHIACLYHGWEYASDGQCRYIPAHPELEVPKTIRVPRYSVADHAGIIWTTGHEDGDVATLPDVCGPVSPVRSLYVDASPEKILACLKNADATASGAPDATVWRATIGKTSLFIAVQPFDDKITALHIIIAAAADVKLRLDAARFAESLRLAAETAPVAEAEQ
ncbi:Rieske (2Fe-2S) protein [Martelella alba]|uniref:Rieske (2Fe-2S) protein n=1 Tax=Martelella alba TaxID=2590451 RepID=A0A506UH79_9HYPH|nr:Rieske (2Fe-2S) protein [Martelella alba]TPW32577.1 Rieske (2Fe-2S) protein [Martelella alba]